MLTLNKRLKSMSKECTYYNDMTNIGKFRDIYIIFMPLSKINSDTI